MDGLRRGCLRRELLAVVGDDFLGHEHVQKGVGVRDVKELVVFSFHRRLISYIVKCASSFMDQNHFDDIFKPFAKVLSDKVCQKTLTSVKSLLVSLYTADESNPRFRYSGLHGILSLEIDRHLNSRFLRYFYE